jgi:acetyl esterase/lipase
MIKLSTIVLILFNLSNLMAQQTIPLYIKIPNAITDGSVVEKSLVGDDGILRISNVITPSMDVYYPEESRSVRAAVVICPGGGYTILASGHEGADVAREFASVGITAFVLKYRLPDSRTQTIPKLAPLQDVQRALQLVRERATEFKIDPAKVGILGFSAGGHLASSAGTLFDKPVIESATAQNVRPDFMILIYPVISADAKIVHGGSFERLLGPRSASNKWLEFSTENRVTSRTPPTFLVHASDDNGVSSLNSVVFYEALLKNNVPAEIHIYQKGGHGFGFKNPTTQDAWFDRLIHWMKANNWLANRG